MAPIVGDDEENAPDAPFLQEQAENGDIFDRGLAFDIVVRKDGRRLAALGIDVYRQVAAPNEEQWWAVDIVPGDKDGVDLIQRPDDKPEVVMKRLVTYHEETKPVVGYYRKNSNVFEVDAGEDIDKVVGKLFKMLDSLAGK